VLRPAYPIATERLVLRPFELVGDVTLFWRSEQHHPGEVGYIFHPGHGGRGYATEATRALLDREWRAA
jgi:RimJ/RimL family protein N-acetyltransferase